MKQEREKLLLALVVRQKLKEAGIPQEKFAIEHQINGDAFRIQLTRNTYSLATLKAVTVLLGCEFDELPGRYAFKKMRSPGSGTISPLEALRRQIKRSLKIRRGVCKSLSHVKSLYAAFGEDRDFNGLKEGLSVTFSLTETPLECTGEGWEVLGTVMIKALQRGATFVYFRPTPQVYNLLLAIMPDILEARSLEDQHVWLLDRLRGSGATVEQLSRVILTMSEYQPPFCAAGTWFQLFVGTEMWGDRVASLFTQFPYADYPDLFMYTDRSTRNACIAYLRHHFGVNETLVELKKLLSRIS